MPCELGGVDLDLAVEDDVLPLDRADMTQQVTVEREVRRGGNARDLPSLPVDGAGEDQGQKGCFRQGLCCLIEHIPYNRTEL